MYPSTMKCCIRMLLLCVLFLLVNGKERRLSKVENTHKNNQDVGHLLNNGHHTARGEKHKLHQSESENGIDLNIDHTLTPTSKFHHEKERNKPYRKHVKSHGRQKSPQSQLQDLKKSILKDQNTEKTAVRMAVQGDVHKPTRRVQKWMDDRQKNAKKPGSSMQKDASKQLLKVRKDMKGSSHHQKNPSMYKHQQPLGKKNVSRERGSSKNKYPREDLVHRMKKNQAHLYKDMTQLKRAQRRVDRDLRRDIQDVNKLNHRHKTVIKAKSGSLKRN